MSLFMKQDFNPPLLSRKWIAIKLRPNMLLYSRDNIISILESGLLFREDCVEVEQETPVQVRRVTGGWMTNGEQVTAAALLLACLVACPPRNLRRTTLLRTAAYLLVPLGVRVAHRRRCRGRLPALLTAMRDYMALARRAAALCREYTALHAKLESLTSAIESTHLMLCRQQSALCVLLARASSAVLGNAPWLRDDLAWDAVSNEESDNLMKIHHAFLVVQSTLLKHIAMAHFVPPSHAQKMCKNHNELIYWIHKTLIEYLIDEFRENYTALERMYRLLKNYGVKDNEPKKPGRAVRDSWLYSDVHTDIARASLELKVALTKCNSIDMFLDACAMNRQELNVVILNQDIEDLIDNLDKCLATTHNSQIRLKKLHRKLEEDNPKLDNDDDVENEVTTVLKIEDKEPETKDEVFYFVKTEDDNVTQAAEDVTTAPGKREKEASKIVMNELKRKLVKREDVMRERERQALAKTMPDLKVVPEFPRQIKLEEVLDRKGLISKIKNNKVKKIKLQRITKNHLPHRRNKTTCGTFDSYKRYRLKYEFYTREEEIQGFAFEANSCLKLKPKYNKRLITFTKSSAFIVVSKWCKKSNPIIKKYTSKPHPDDPINRLVNNHSTENFKVSKKDLELTSSESESDFDLIERGEILRDIRHHRVNRKRDASIDTADESLRPIEYSLGTGLAMASVLQINSFAHRRNMAEEEFIGDGEVSDDSGNDD